MDFKKQCIQFKKNAKKLGYNIKLTHIQELLAQMEGFSNRHGKLASISKNKKAIKKSSGIKIDLCTDDFLYDFCIEIDQEYMLWALDNDRGFIDMILEGDYGPDAHTDNLLYNMTNPELDDVKNYLTLMGKINKPVGFSITIDTDTFLKWKKQNFTLLQDKGYFV